MIFDDRCEDEDDWKVVGKANNRRVYVVIWEGERGGAILNWCNEMLWQYICKD